MSQLFGCEQNILHIFLQYGAGEKLTNDQLALHAREYMKGMKRDHLPYLVYRHDDAHNLHTHIVSTIIQENGKRNELSRSDYYKPRQLTRALEKQYALQPSGPEARRELSRQYYVQQIKYGAMPLLPTMSNVLEVVVPEYRYTCLPELNAILMLYHMEASRGKEGSWTYRNGGLIFQPFTPDGKPEGAYIKASVFDCKPTLKNLEKKFAENVLLREPHRERLTTAIEWALAGKMPGFNRFREELERDGISIVAQKDKSGGPEQIWFVDHQARTVFGNSALGERYTANAIRQRCISEETYQQQLQLEQSLRQELRLSL